MESICYSSRSNDSMLAFNSRKRRRNQYSPIQYQEISPPLTDCTDLSTDGFVPQSFVTPSPSTFSVGNTGQDLSRRSTLDSQHMWDESTPVNDDFTLEGWRPNTPIPQSDNVPSAIPIQYPDDRFNFQYPHQAADADFSPVFEVSQNSLGIEQLLTSDEPPLRVFTNFHMPNSTQRAFAHSPWGTTYQFNQPDSYFYGYHGGMAQPDDQASLSEPAIALQEYEAALRQSLEFASRNELEKAATAIRKASELLGTHVDTLRLYQSNPFPNTLDPAQDWLDRRQELLANFSQSWLGMLQKQKDMTEARLRGERIEPPQSRIQTRTLEKLGDDVLIPLCDKFYPKGLVDWHAGIWEERIVDILLECRELGEELDRKLTRRHSSTS